MSYFIPDERKNLPELKLPCPEQPTCRQLIDAIKAVFASGCPDKSLCHISADADMPGIKRRIAELFLNIRNQTCEYLGLESDAIVTDAVYTKQPYLDMYQIDIKITLKNDGSVKEPPLIPLVYCIYGGESIVIISKEWYDKNHCWPDGPRIESKDYPDDTYNYYSEICHLMEEAGTSFIEESLFGLPHLHDADDSTESRIKTLKKFMAKRGFELIEDNSL